jgi:superfamily II DNA or RNA helicase
MQKTLQLFDIKPLQQLKLREYQIQIIKEIYQYFRIGKKACMVVSATGSGKTATSAKLIADAVSKGRRVLFCCHRQKLVKQTQSTLERFFGIESGIIWADHPINYDLPVQIGMIQTLQNRQLPEDIGLVVFDECHTVAHYQVVRRIMDKYSNGIYPLSPCYFIGLTATPWRTKTKEGFCQYFDCIVRGPYPKDLIKQGWLCPPRHFGWNGLIDFSKLETSSDGDYTEKSMQAVCNEEFNDAVVQKFMELCPERKAIAFCASVIQSQDLASKFNDVGVTAACIVGTTPQDERDRIFQMFNTGDIQLISSVGVLCEGFDEPSVAAAIIARPTKSKSLLIQMAGRALRLHESKTDAWLLDFCENFKRIGHVTRRHKITLCPQPRPDFEPPTKECPQCHAMIDKWAKICPECGYEFGGDKEEEESEQLDLFNATFGELLDDEEKKKVTYVRSQMKRAYKAGRLVSKVRMMFHEKFGEIPPRHWFLGAVFGGNNPTVNQKVYLEYLYKIRPNANAWWIRQQMELEFGEPGRLYFDGKYQVPPIDCDRISWREFFDISFTATWDDVKAQYTEVVRQSDSNEIQLANIALEQAREFFNEGAVV